MTSNLIIIVNTDSEQSTGENYNTILVSSTKNFDYYYHESYDKIPLYVLVPYFVGKDGTKWFRKKPAQNIATYD